MASNQDTGQDGMRFRTTCHAVASRRFARDHSRSQLPFSLVVGRVQIIYVQEAQQMSPMLPQPLGEPGVVGVGESPTLVDQLIQPLFNPRRSLGEGFFSAYPNNPLLPGVPF
jgi:hypothetical protein